MVYEVTDVLLSFKFCNIKFTCRYFTLIETARYTLRNLAEICFKKLGRKNREEETLVTYCMSKFLIHLYFVYNLFSETIAH